MPAYDWSCHACEQINNKAISSCLACGCPSIANAKQIDEYKTKPQPGASIKKQPKSNLGSLLLVLLPLFLISIPTMRGRSVPYMYSDSYDFITWAIAFPIVYVLVGLAYFLVPIGRKTMFRHVLKANSLGYLKGLMFVAIVAAGATFMGSGGVPALATWFGSAAYTSSARVLRIKASGGVLIDVQTMLENGKKAVVRQFKHDPPAVGSHICLDGRSSVFGTVIDSMRQGGCP